MPVYNLELLGGVIHNELGLALSWGGADRALAATGSRPRRCGSTRSWPPATERVLIVAQRTLSTPVRKARRELGDAASVAPLERALRLLAFGNIVLGAAVVAARLRWLR